MMGCTHTHVGRHSIWKKSHRHTIRIACAYIHGEREKNNDAMNGWCILMELWLLHWVYIDLMAPKTKYICNNNFTGLKSSRHNESASCCRKLSKRIERLLQFEMKKLFSILIAVMNCSSWASTATLYYSFACHIEWFLTMVIYLFFCINSIPFWNKIGKFSHFHTFYFRILSTFCSIQSFAAATTQMVEAKKKSFIFAIESNE